ncbi:MAG TPA: alpha/beta hydrolase [Acidimicrobiia bacterium]
MGRLGRWLLGFFVAWRVFGPIITPRFGSAQDHPWKVSGRTVFVGDLEFLVRQVGDAAKPDVVLIHGLGGASLTEWYGIGPLLVDDFRRTIVENRNHGLSPRVTSRYRVEDTADDVAAVMAAVGVERAHVVGYSMGGTVAQALAHRHPDRVERLALVATFAFHPPVWKWARMVGSIVVRAWERATGTGTPEVRAGYLLLTGAVNRKYAKFMWEETHRRDPDGGAAASMALFRFDSRPWVSTIDKPTLVMIPGRDQLVPVGWQRDLASRLPHATVETIDGAFHELVWTHPDRVAESLRSFFAETEDGPQSRPPATRPGSHVNRPAG